MHQKNDEKTYNYFFSKYCIVKKSVYLCTTITENNSTELKM